MSLQDIQFLFHKYKIVPNKLLGQNFLIDTSLFSTLSEYAALNSNDIVLDVGAGFGFLTRYLAGKCKVVIAVEKDPSIVLVLREQVKNLSNVDLIENDVLHANIPFFNKVISLPPYYLSSQLISWLLDRKFECAVLVIQKEFAKRLVSPVGCEEYGWLTVLTRLRADVDLLNDVSRQLFYPRPEVDSVILRLTAHATPTFAVKDVALFKRLIKWLFTQRNKKVRNAITPFIRRECKIGKPDAEKLACTLPLRNSRTKDLSPMDFGEIANALAL